MDNLEMVVFIRDNNYEMYKLMIRNELIANYYLNKLNLDIPPEIELKLIKILKINGIH